MYGMHRADLLNVLTASLPSGAVRTGHRCIEFEQDAASAHLKFANRESADADIVIAADGIHSVLQKCVVEPNPPEYSGVGAYRGLIPREKLPDWPEGTHQVWMGEGKHFIVYPVRSGQLLNYVGFVPTRNKTIKSWSAIGDLDELAASFRAILHATMAAIVTALLVIVAFVSAMLHFAHEYGVALLFILALSFFFLSLLDLARETRIGLHEFDYHA